MTTDLFAQATRHDVKFQLPQGEVTVQQLWKISGTTLEKYEIALKAEVKEFGEVIRRKSPAKTPVQELTELKLSIVSYILDVREVESDAVKSAQEKKIHNAPILAIMAQRDMKNKESLSMEELEKLLIK